MTQPRSRLLLVDGHNVAYRAFHALPPMNAPDGTPTNAVLGVSRILGSLRETWSPSHVCVVFDGGLPEARLAALAEYKAQRAPMPDLLRPQFDLIMRHLSLQGLAHLRIDGEEADDVLATLARRAAADGADVLIVSGDKDLLQLAGEDIGILRPQTPRERIGTDGVRAILGVDPARVPEWLALTGDTSDNIPGVPGIGPKTATVLLTQFGSMDALWGRTGEVASARIRGLLETHRAVVERNLGMMRLREDLPGLPVWTDFACSCAKAAELRMFLEALGMRSLLPPTAQMELF